MDTNSELEELKRQKREIERRIKELTNVYEVDGAKMFVKKFPTHNEVVVTLETIDGARNKRSANKEIIQANTKEDAIRYLELTINTLVNLYKEIKGKNNSEDLKFGD